jgi:hypothetical protein
MPLSLAQIQNAVADFQWSQDEEDQATQLHREFLKLYPRERISSLTLDDYALGKGKGACWWVEFGTEKLGRIGGATAFKHVVFFDSKANQWRYNKKYTSEDEAFRAVRSGLLKLFDLAEHDQFAGVDSVAPFQNQNLTRGKWLYLYFPDKFLPIFSTDNLSDFCQMFGITVADPAPTLLNRALLEYKTSTSLFTGWSNLRFMRFLYTKFPPVAFWKIAPGEKASEWADCQAGGYICIGWDGIGDLSQYEDQQSLKKAMLEENPKDTMKQVSQVWRFKHIEKGDMIVANRGMTSIVGLGRATGPYFFNAERAHYKHCLPVEWFQTTEYPINDKAVASDWFGYTLKKLTRQEYERLSIPTTSGSVLRWQRDTADSFDLVLENPAHLDHAAVAQLYQQFMASECAAQPNFNEYLRDDLASWIANPEKPLPSVAYASLSNWFTTAFAALSSSPRAAAARKLWDALFLCAPGERLSSPESGQNHIVLKEPFELWWNKQLELQGSVVPAPRPPAAKPGGRFAQLCHDTSLPASFFQDCERLLETKRQFILQGAPGTGKTFVAEKLAAWWAGADGRVLPVQFHESYGYEDFVHGIRPHYDSESKTTSFVPEDGVFLKFCESARSNPAKHVLIIDEINRAKTARVFGELLWLLEYRNKSITLQYGQQFSIPDNVYIIGTMNTVDRSIALVDYALRRRFAFMTLWPVRGGKSVVLSAWMQSRGIENAGEVDALFVALNTAIAEKEEALMVGHSYLMVEDAAKGKKFTEDLLDFIWRSQILPLVAEYEYQLNSDQVEEKYGLTAIRKRVGLISKAASA